MSTHPTHNDVEILRSFLGHFCHVVGSPTKELNPIKSQIRVPFQADVERFGSSKSSLSSKLKLNKVKQLAEWYF